MDSISDLSWKKVSFGDKLRLFYRSRKEKGVEIKLGDQWEQASACSALSSTYYSVASTAHAQIKARWKRKAFVLFRLPEIIAWALLGGYCYWRMLPLSNRVVKLIGYGGMSADQCDVRQSILRCRGKDSEAVECILNALTRKKPEKAHTRGLLRVGLANVYIRESRQVYRRNAKENIELALAEVAEAEQEFPEQAVRILRHCADLLCRIDPGNQTRAEALREKAEELARGIGAKDQTLKIANS